MRNRIHHSCNLWIFAIGIFLLTLVGCATNQADYSPGVDQEDILLRSIYSMDDIMESADNRVPTPILAGAKAVIIFPSLVKVGLVGGAQKGDGVVSVRHKGKGKWGRPAFVKIRGASFGIQAGVQEIDLILFIMTNSGVRKLFSENLALGRDLSISAGPVGRRYETEPLDLLQSKKAIYSYSLAKGAFAGTSFQGAMVSPDTEANRNYYGRHLSPKTILLSSLPKKPQKSTSRFLEELNKLAPAAKK